MFPIYLALLGWVRYKVIGLVRVCEKSHALAGEVGGKVKGEREKH
jgi:hypothetical protein